MGLEFLVLYFLIMFIIAFTQATRRIPIIFANQFDKSVSFTGAQKYISFKLNNTGIMPVIFAQTLMFIPSFILASFANKSDIVLSMSKWFMDVTSWQYSFIFSILIILFTFFYTAITVNPDTLAADMKRQNSFIPGVSSGKETSKYLDDILSKLTLPSAIILAVIAILPIFAKTLGVSPSFSRFFGGSSVIILVGVMLDIIQQIQNFSILSKYGSIGSKSDIKKIKK